MIQAKQRALICLAKLCERYADVSDAVPTLTRLGELTRKHNGSREIGRASKGRSSRAIR